MKILCPAFALHPIHNSSADILKCFALDKPLTSEQAEFLNWHHDVLSNPELRPILDYYRKQTKSNENRYHAPFLQSHEEMNGGAVESLKKRLQLYLKQKNSQASIRLTHKQYLQFKQYNIQDLIYWHGNQFLTGAPFYPGGIPHVIYFQWGNMFGIVKPSVLAGEEALKANILIYFVDMMDRDIDRCVLDYDKQVNEDLINQNKLLYQNTLTPPSPEAQSHFKTPTLRLTDYFLLDHLHE